MNLRTTMLTAAIALGLPVLSACAGSSSSDSKPSPSLSTASVVVVNESSVLTGKFVKDFRATFPKIAVGRGDAALAQDAVDACHEVVKGDTRRTDLITLVATAFTVDGEAPNDATVIKILNLMVKDACPDRSRFLASVL